MITEEQTDLIVERLVDRVEQANTYFLMQLGEKIKKIRKLTPSEAHQLVQILKYGGEYDDIVREIAKYTNLNIADIDSIFASYAKKDYEFAQKFYEYRKIPFVPYEQNATLKMQKEVFSNMVKNQMYNFTRNNVLGYTIRDINGNMQFLGLKDTYNRVLDEALLNVGQGKQTFDTAMAQIMKEIGGSGLKTLNYASGRSIRLDSAIRMHLKGRLREFHNENQQIIGSEIDADGVEITVHSNPAEDHAEAQGHQLYNDQFNLLQTAGVAKDVNGKELNLHKENKDGEEYGTFRPISEMNCYHYIFSIIVGVSKPEYTDEELQKIIDDNNKGFDYEGKHYSNYEGTQLQRQLERKIREQKDIQILAKASDNKELILESQQNITILTNKYKELSDISGLPTKMDRLKVSSYKRVAKKKLI